MEKDLRNSDLYELRFGLKEKKSNYHFWLTIILVLFFVLSFRTYWSNTFGGVEVDGNSMNMTLNTGEKLLMRYSEDGSEAKRGDVIVVYVGNYEECEGVASHFLIKRLIAVEGDKVKCKDGNLYICYAGTQNYVLLDEPYAYYTDKNSYDFGEYVVGEGEIFFLGDNRNNSCDSRYNETYGSHLEGLYKRQDIFGIVPDWAIEKRSLLEKLFF